MLLQRREVHLQLKARKSATQNEWSAKARAAVSKATGLRKMITGSLIQSVTVNAWSAKARAAAAAKRRRGKVVSTSVRWKNPTKDILSEISKIKKSRSSGNFHATFKIKKSKGERIATVRQEDNHTTSTKDANHLRDLLTKKGLKVINAWSEHCLQQELDMARKLKPEVREKIVNDLVGNCSCQQGKSIFKGMDLKEVPDAVLHGIGKLNEVRNRSEAIANAAVEGFEDELGNVHKFNAEFGQWETWLNENAGGDFFKKMMEKKKAKAKGSKDDMEDMMDDEEEESKSKKKPATNSLATNSNSGEKKPMTDQEWLASAPPSVRSAVQNAMRIEAGEKAKKVERLTANISDDAMKAKASETLMVKSLEELDMLVGLLPPVVTPAPSYAGLAPVGNNGTRPRFTDDDLLVPPTINWAGKG